MPCALVNTVGVWDGHLPAGRAQAAVIYEELYARYGTGSVGAPGRPITTVVGWLEEHYPAFGDPGCPWQGGRPKDWAFGPLLVIQPVEQRRAEIACAVQPICARLGLTLFDPRSGLLT